MRYLREGLRWGMYDFGNSAYVLVFSIYLIPTILNNMRDADSLNIEMAWGLAQGVAVLFAVLLGLILGPRIDRRGVHYVAPYLIILAAASSYLLPAIFSLWAKPIPVLLVYVVVHTLFLLSITAYDATLVDKPLSNGMRLGVSAWAWGWGYIGGVLCLLLIMAVGSDIEKMLIGATFFALFAILSLRTLKYSRIDAHADTSPKPGAMSEITGTRARRSLLLRMLVSVEGIAIFMAYTTLYARNVSHINDRQVQLLLLALQLLSFIFTGLVVKVFRYQVSRILYYCGIVWFIVSIEMAMMTNLTGFIIATVLVSTCVGALQSTLRSIYSEFVAEDRPMSGFSVYAVVEKGAAFIGPALAGILIGVIGYIPVFIAAGLLVFVGSILTANLYTASMKVRV